MLPSWRRRLAPATSLAAVCACALARRSAHVGILGLVGVGNLQQAPSPSSALPPTQPPRLLCYGSATAVPPYISGRTSYLRVRLEFLLYPQVIPQFCNTGGCGPRRGLTPASPCPWVAHPVSGRMPATLQRYAPVAAPSSDGSLSLRLHGSVLTRGSPDWQNQHGCCRLTWGGPCRLARRRHPLAGSFFKRHAVRRCPTMRTWCAGRPPTACRYRVSGSLSFPSRGAFHLSLTVLVPYRWPRVCSPWRVVPPASHRISRVPWYSGIWPHPSPPSPTGLSPSVVGHPRPFG